MLFILKHPNINSSCHIILKLLLIHICFHLSIQLQRKWNKRRQLRSSAIIMKFPSQSSSERVMWCPACTQTHKKKSVSSETCMNKYTLNWIQWVKPQTRTIGSKTCITTYIFTVFSIPLGMELSCFSDVLHLMSLYSVANKRDCLTYFICSSLHFYVDHSLVEFTGSFCGIQGMEISVIKIDLKNK